MKSSNANKNRKQQSARPLDGARRLVPPPENRPKEKKLVLIDAPTLRQAAASARRSETQQTKIDVTLLSRTKAAAPRQVTATIKVLKVSTDKKPMDKCGYAIARASIRKLLGTNWINDVVINFYFQLLVERAGASNYGLPDIYALSTQDVAEVLLKRNYETTRCPNVDIFAKDLVLMPVHTGGLHWLLAIFHVIDQKIRFYDPMNRDLQPDIVNALELFLENESRIVHQKPFKIVSYEVMRDIPRPTSESDCIVFNCLYAERVARGTPINFTQENISVLRKKMLLEILQGKLFD